MPALVNFGGDEDRYKDSGLFSSLASDLYFQPRKRSRVAAPFMFGAGELFAAALPPKPPRSIDSLPDECLFEVLRRLAGPQERSVSACVSKRWLSLLTSIRASEISEVRSGDGSKFVKVVLPDLNEDGVVDVEAAAEEESAVQGGHLTRCLEASEATDIRLAALAVGAAGRGGLGKLLIRGSNKKRGVTDSGLSAIARGCPSLEVLSMWKVPLVTDAGLAEIAAGCPLLERLELYHCPLISDKGLMAVARNSPNLTTLTIEACSGINNEGLPAIGRHCSKLQSVSIKDCPGVGDVGVSGLASAATSSLAKIKLQNLNITDSSLAVIGYYGKALTELSLTGLQNVKEKGFWVMGSTLGMNKLRSLFITSCNGVTDLGLQAIAKGSPNLKQLSIYGSSFLTDAGLRAFFAEAGALESLQLEECNSVTLVGVLGVLFGCNSKLKALSLVKCLGIKDIGFYPKVSLYTSLRTLTVRDCPGFTSRSLVFFGTSCSQLQQINLSGLAGVTDAGLLPLIQRSPSVLVKVTLNGCVNVTDAAIFALTKAHGETLQLLHLDGCIKITDRSLLAISGNCYVLDDLDLSRCAITDYGVAALASARQLDMRTLSMGSCSKLTEKCLPFLGNMGQSLTGLNLQYCNLISQHGISLLEEKLWWCDILS